MLSDEPSPALVAFHFHQLREKRAVEEHRIAPSAPIGGNDDGRVSLLVAFAELGDGLRRDTWLVGQDEEGRVHLRLQGCESRPHRTAQTRFPLLVDHDLDRTVGDAGSYLWRAAAQDDDHLLEGRVQGDVHHVLEHGLVAHWQKLLSLTKAPRLAGSEHDGGHCRRLPIADCRLPIDY